MTRWAAVTAIAAAAVWLSGCTPNFVWVKDGVRHETAPSDLSACGRDLHASYRWGEFQGVKTQTAFLDRCMEAKGWTKEPR